MIKIYSESYMRIKLRPKRFYAIKASVIAVLNSESN
jgi:hypothetical protein